jgi:hypothetical protein
MRPKKGETTTIVIQKTTHEQLSNYKIIHEEPFDSVIIRIMNENESLKKGIIPISNTEIKDTIISQQTKTEMEKELVEYVLNPDVDDSPSRIHRQIWQENHPNEILTPDDVIHHINGLHFDNRPENLEKITPKEHSQTHADIRKEQIEKKQEMIKEISENGHI